MVDRDAPTVGGAKDGASGDVSHERVSAAPDSIERLPERYETRRIIGRGGMGVVVEARDRVLERDVAVKILQRRLFTDGMSRARFLREARAASVVDHPVLVTVHDVDPVNGFIVMELVRGESLRDRIARDDKLAPAEVRRIGVALLEALDVAHAAGIVHRDIKPANVLLDEHGGVKLVDFGIAHIDQSDLTTTNTVLGTPAYMAPEQLRGHADDPRVDLYAVGATLFEAATGTKLHAEGVPHASPEDAVREATGDAALAAAIASAVRQRPVDRTPTAAAFLAGLKGVAEPTPPRPGGKRRRIAALVAGVVVTAGAAAFAIRAPGGAQPVATSSAGASSLTASAAAAPRVIAVLPFADDSGNPQLDFTRSGLPHLIGEELSRDSGLRVVGHYQLRQHVAADASDQAWVEAARAAGVDVVVRGALRMQDQRLHLTVSAEELGSGRRLIQIERDAAAEDVSAAAHGIAAEVGSAALGRPMQQPPSAGHALDVERELQLGIEAMERNDVIAADDHLSSAVRTDSTLGEAMYYLAIVSWWRDRPKDATTHLIDGASSMAISEVQRSFLVGLRLFVEGKLRDATVHFRDAVDRYPQDRDSRYGLFEALYHSGYPADAIRVYQDLRRGWPRYRLGEPHALEYEAARGDPSGLAWAESIARDDSGGLDPHVVAQFALSRRDPARAIDVLQAAIEDPDVDAGRRSAMRHLLGVAYAVTGRTRLALDYARPDPLPVDQLGWTLALGDPSAVRAARETALATCDRNAGNGHPRQCLQIILMESASPDGGWLSRVEAAVERGVAPHEFVFPELVRVFMDGLRNDSHRLDDDRRSEYPEVAAAAEGFLAAARHDWTAAAKAWDRAADADLDGSAYLGERFFAAGARRGATDHEGTVRSCADVVDPHEYEPSWGGLVGQCLVWTAQARAASGNAPEAHAACERLRAFRAGAPQGDALLATCAAVH